MAPKRTRMKTIPTGALWIGLSVYTLMIAGFSIIATTIQSHLTAPQLRGIIQSLQSIASENREIEKLLNAGQLSPHFAQGEMSTALKIVDDLRSTANNTEVSGSDLQLKKTALDLASKTINGR